MHSTFGRSVVAVAVCGMCTLFASSRVALASTPPNGGAFVLPPVVVTAPVRASKAEPHPEIQAAIRSLERAKAHLQAAAHDFQGHRVDAIAAIDAALHQLHICMDYDR
jgi:hypothetical protein